VAGLAAVAVIVDATSIERTTYLRFGTGQLESCTKRSRRSRRRPTGTTGAVHRVRGAHHLAVRPPVPSEGLPGDPCAALDAAPIRRHLPLAGDDLPDP